MDITDLQLIEDRHCIANSIIVGELSPDDAKAMLEEALERFRQRCLNKAVPENS